MLALVLHEPPVTAVVLDVPPASAEPPAAPPVAATPPVAALLVAELPPVFALLLLDPPMPPVPSPPLPAPPLWPPFDELVAADVPPADSGREALSSPTHAVAANIVKTHELMIPSRSVMGLCSVECNDRLHRAAGAHRT